MKEILIVSIGSFFGGGMRYWISKMVQSCTVIAFPFGTMAVNVAGCLIIGFLSGLNWQGRGMDVAICQTAAHHGVLRRIHHLLYLHERGGGIDEGGKLPLYDALSIRKPGTGTRSPCSPDIIWRRLSHKTLQKTERRRTREEDRRIERRNRIIA